MAISSGPAFTMLKIFCLFLLCLLLNPGLKLASSQDGRERRMRRESLGVRPPRSTSADVKSGMNIAAGYTSNGFIGMGSSMISESIRYSNSELAKDQDAEFKRQAKMFRTSKILSGLLQDYDSRLRPQFGGDPVEVDITLHVDSLGPISETDMSFRVDFAFRQYWMDKRLEFAEESNESITLSHEFLHKIWLPDTYFPESLSADKHSVMVPNILLRLSPEGQVLYSCRVTVVSKCPMELEYFPLDTQNCSLIIEAYGYTVRDLRLQWKNERDEEGKIKEAVQVAECKLSQFKFIDHKTDSYELKFSTGNFSDLEVIFIFERRLLYFVLQSYVPATLIVNLSWVSFWVDPKSIPARASLAITTVLTMITLMGTVNSQLPKVSNIKALDVYFGMCFFYVFGALIEFAAVCYCDKARQKMLTMKRDAEKVAQQAKEADKNRMEMLREVDGLAKTVSSMGTNCDNSLNSSHATQPLLGSKTRSLNIVEGESGYPVAPHSNNNGSFGTGSRNGLTTAPFASFASSFNNTRNRGATPQPMMEPHEKKSSGSKSSMFSCSYNFDVLKIDNCSRVIFPSTFLILNLVYWGAYTNIMNRVTNSETS